MNVTTNEDARYFVMRRPAFRWLVESWHPTREAAERAMRKDTGDMLIAKVLARNAPPGSSSEASE